MKSPFFNRFNLIAFILLSFSVTSLPLYLKGIIKNCKQSRSRRVIAAYSTSNNYQIGQKKANYPRIPKKKSFGEGDAEVKGTEGKRDNWKVLMKKLDYQKPDERYGKSRDLSNEDVDILNKGEDMLKCIHFQECSGCTIRANFTSAPVMIRAEKFFKSEGISFKIHASNFTGWRTHVKLAVQPLSKWGGLRFGLYKAGTHEVVSIPQCRVHHPQLNIAAEQLRLAATDVGVKAYSPSNSNNKQFSAQGELRYIQLSLERFSGKVQAVLVWNALTYKDCESTLPRLVKRLKSSRPDLWHSITVNFNTQSTNAIFNYEPEAWKLLWGPPYLREKVGDAMFYFRPQIFRQANLDFFETAIIPQVLKHVPEGSKVAELYSGICLIGLNLARKAADVCCSDTNNYVAEVFDKCADSLEDKAASERVFYECIDADEAVTAGQCDAADVLVVDPPRKGLTDGVMKFLLNKHEEKRLGGLKRLIYVGCGYDAVEEDTRALLSSGLWKIRQADGYALFPGSDHVETVVAYDRVR